MFEHPCSFRAYFPMQFVKDVIYGPVEARSVAEAAAALALLAGGPNVKVLHNMQRMINGMWVWEDCDGPTGS